MITMSDDFKNSVSATEREMKGYVEVAYMSTGDKDTYVIENEPEILAINGTNIDDRQLLDNDRKGRNYASLEEDYFLLDGTFVLPNNVYNKNPGMGYVSKYTYQTQQEEITDVNPFHITCNATDCSGITVYFKNNRPLDLEFRVNTSDGLFTYTDIDIIDNGVASVTFNKTTVTDLYIVVNDVLYPNRRLRLQEVDFGLSAIYEGEDLISFKTIEQCDRFADTMAINECEVVLGDYTGKFDVNNPNSITQYLGKDVLIKPFVGVITEDNGVEYCSLGTYWLDQWKTDKSSATLIAKDIFTKMEKANYWLTTDNSCNYNDYLSTKASDWGININEYVDENDYAITHYDADTLAVVNPKLYEPDTYLENLQKFCITFGNTITSERNGDLKYISSKGTDNVDVVIYNYLLKQHPEVNDKNKIKDINVTEYNYVGTATASEYMIVFEKTFNLDGITEIKAPLGGYNWAHVNFSTVPTIIQSNIATTSSSDYTLAGWTSQLYLKINYSGQITIRVDAPKNFIELSEYVNTYNMNETGDTVDIQNDMLTGAQFFITGSRLGKHSRAIIDYRVQNISDKTEKIQFNGNPTIECGDCIEVENKYLDENDQPRYDKIWVTKIESEFNGSFNQTIEGDILE